MYGHYKIPICISKRKQYLKFVFSNIGKPVPVTTNITLGVTDSTGIKFSVTVIAYPDPWYELKNENGTKNIQKMDNTTIRNSVNNFTINFNQTVVKKDDYGTYFLQIGNRFGVTTVQINVLPQSKC